jgi:hypothetical protein
MVKIGTETHKRCLSLHMGLNFFWKREGLMKLPRRWSNSLLKRGNGSAWRNFRQLFKSKKGGPRCCDRPKKILPTNRPLFYTFFYQDKNICMLKDFLKKKFHMSENRDEISWFDGIPSGPKSAQNSGYTHIDLMKINVFIVTVQGNF